MKRLQSPHGATRSNPGDPCDRHQLESRTAEPSSWSHTARFCPARKSRSDAERCPCLASSLKQVRNSCLSGSIFWLVIMIFDRWLQLSLPTRKRKEGPTLPTSIVQSSSILLTRHPVELAQPQDVEHWRPRSNVTGRLLCPPQTRDGYVVARPSFVLFVMELHSWGEGGQFLTSTMAHLDHHLRLAILPRHHPSADKWH